jgi:hypothetical protein
MNTSLWFRYFWTAVRSVNGVTLWRLRRPRAARVIARRLREIER